MLFCIDYCMWIFFGLMIYFSIGSLGSGKSEEFVLGIRVNRAKIFGTKNGVRIKTWQVIN